MSTDSQPLTLADFKLLMAEHEGRDEERNRGMMDKFMSAFPNGEPLPHKSYHQSKIDAARAEKEFWEAAKVKIFEQGVSGVVSGLKIVLLLAITGAAYKLGLAIPFMGKP